MISYTLQGKEYKLKLPLENHYMRKSTQTLHSQLIRLAKKNDFLRSSHIPPERVYNITYAKSRNNDFFMNLI